MANFSIRSSTIRLGIFISTLVIAIILVFQLIWLRELYDFEQKEFDHSVIKAVRGLYEDIDAKAYYSSHLNDLIENPGSHLYLVKIELPVNGDSLSEYLHYELEDFSIFTDCYMGIYSAAAGKYIYTDELPAAASKEKNKVLLPQASVGYDHLALYFPHRSQYIIAQMNFWIISSALLLFVLLLFGTSLYFFYKQKFLNETQKDFIHNFTHEFKTPVSVIGLAADVLKNPSIVEKPEKLNTYANIVKHQSNYLQSQIERLLQFAHTESRRLHLTKEKVNIHDLVQEAVSNLAPLIAEKNSQLTLELGASDPFLEADRDYLIIVITNLIDNAIKYARQPSIVITTKNAGNRLSFTVKDNGTGIESKQIKNIFNKFTRVKNGETYSAKGFGLGLSFVKKIVTAHGGEVKVKSIPSKGSEFTIVLPIH